MKKPVLAALALLALCGSAAAESFNLPTEGKPVASVTFPDSWKAEETDEGLQAFSGGNEVAFYVELTTGTDVSAAVDKQIKFLADNGVVVDGASIKQSDEQVNGMAASFTDFDGKDENGPVIVGIYFVGVSDDTMVMVTNWASKNEEGGFEENIKQEVRQILNSIKPAG